jgi:monoamine oxidase
MSDVHDVIIVGAGFAGLAAARHLNAHGKSVAVLEASERAGGRVWAKPLAQDTVPLDWGAEWVIPHLHPRVMAEAARLGLTVDTGTTAARTCWRMDGTTHVGTFQEVRRQRPRFDAALTAIEAEAKLRPVAINCEGNLRDYFLRQAENTEDAALLECAVFPLTGSAPEETSVLMLWDEIRAHDYSIDETLDGNTHRFLEGVGQIGPALAAELGDRIIYGAKVQSIHDTGSGIEVRAGDTVYRSAACIVAVPLRTLHAIAFTPGLPLSLLTTAEHSNAGRVAKVWAKVRCAEPPDSVLHSTSPLRYGYARASIPGEWYVCGQYLVTDDAPVSIPVLREVFTATWPGIEVLTLEATDWPSLPLAQGSWHTGRAGYAGDVAEFRAPYGRIHFAGGDIAEVWAGWMEGAMLSGEVAADRVL